MLPEADIAPTAERDALHEAELTASDDNFDRGALASAAGHARFDRLQEPRTFTEGVEFLEMNTFLDAEVDALHVTETTSPRGDAEGDMLASAFRNAARGHPIPMIGRTRRDSYDDQCDTLLQSRNPLLRRPIELHGGESRLRAYLRHQNALASSAAHGASPGSRAPAPAHVDIDPLGPSSMLPATGQVWVNAAAAISRALELSGPAANNTDGLQASADRRHPSSDERRDVRTLIGMLRAQSDQQPDAEAVGVNMRSSGSEQPILAHQPAERELNNSRDTLVTENRFRDWFEQAMAEASEDMEEVSAYIRRLMDATRDFRSSRSMRSSGRSLAFNHADDPL